MEPARYLFESTWRLPVPPPVAFEVLRDLRSYPAWWPEVRQIERISDERARATVKSALPYALRFDLVRTREDAEAGILETRLEGDLAGVTRWVITPDGDGSSCRFEEDVVTGKRLLNALAPVARWAFRLNHAWMMRNGRRGLQRYLRSGRYTSASSS